MDHAVDFMFLEQLLHRARIGDVPLHQTIGGVGVHAFQIGRISGVRQLVQIDQFLRLAGALVQQQADIIRSDKSASSSDQ